MKRYAWAARGDVNAFFGLMLDNVAVMVLFVSLIAGSAVGQYTRQFVLTRMIPGTALGVLLGDLVYTAMAFRLARRSGRCDVTAMPLGLDTPSTIGIALFVMLPALTEGNKLFPADHEQAMLFGWHVGVAVLVLVGLFKVACAPLGNAVRRWVPRAGLLGSLAAIALALIAFMPLLMDVASVPLAGFVVLTVILLTLVAHRAMPYKVPGALAAVVLGVVLVFGGRALGDLFGAPLVPAAPPGVEGARLSLPSLSPFTTFEWGWWKQVLWVALEKLPVALPFALATIVGGIDCTESAAAAGDEYDTRTVLLTEGVASVAAGLLGGVIQTTPYIGHPAYKKMGGRAAYTLATALFVGAAGVFGVFGILFEFLPPAAMFPILVFVGLEITAQSFHATPVKHYPALAFAFLPTLAALALIPMNDVLGQRPPASERGEVVQTTLRCLANGFIVTSLLWAAALAALMDGRLRQSAAYLLFAGACALFGVIHSPLPESPIALPWNVYARLNPREVIEATHLVGETFAAQGVAPAGPPTAAVAQHLAAVGVSQSHVLTRPPAVLCQSPYHWAGAYVLSAALLVGLSFFRAEREEISPDGGAA